MNRTLTLIASTLFLSSCATVQRASVTIADAVNMLGGVTANVNAVLDSPAPLANTEQDEQMIRSAYKRFDQGLTIIESLVDNRIITPRSTTALSISDGIGVVQRALHGAYTAQRIGDAATMRATLVEARTALVSITAAVQEGN